MKILFLVNFYYPNEIGGAEIQTRNVVNFASGFADVQVLTFDGHGETTHEVKDNVRIYRFYIKTISEKLLNYVAKRKRISKFKVLSLLINPFLFKRIKRNFLQIKPNLGHIDIVHISSNLILVPTFKLFNYLRTEFPDTKIVYSVHDHYSLGRRSNFPHKRRFLYTMLFQKSLVNNIDYFVCPSGFIRKKCLDDLKINSEKVIKIYNSVNFELQFKVDRECEIITYAGSIEYMKGLDILADAFIKLYKYDDNLKLYIIGEGNYSKVLENKLLELPNTSYRFLGKLDHVEVLQILELTSFIILPSRYEEIFGMSLIEGYYKSAIPLGSRSGAIPEILNFDQDLIFEDAEDLEKKIKNLFDESKKRDKLSSLEKHMRNFSQSVVSKEYFEFYNHLLKE